MQGWEIEYVVMTDVIIYQVPGNVPVHGKKYVKRVSIPYIDKFLLKIYPRQMQKVIFHQDKARAHTALFTIAEVNLVG